MSDGISTTSAIINYKTCYNGGNRFEYLAILRLTKSVQNLLYKYLLNIL